MNTKLTTQNITSKPRLRILVISDGITGHINLSHGLLNWIGNRYEYKVQFVDSRLHAKPLSRLILPWLIQWKISPNLLTQFYKYSNIELEQPNIIISMGGNTSFLNIALARSLNIPNIFMGSKRRLNPDDFSAHLTLEPTNQAHNIVMKISPSVINASKLAQQGVQLRNTLKCTKKDKIYLIALGGDGSGYRYDKTACKQIANLMKTISQEDNCKWLLTTSRRTGGKVESTLQSLLDPKLLIDAVWWNEKPRPILNHFMGAADQIFVSIDSMSMIGEAIASGKPTILLEPKSAAPNSNYKQTLENYCNASYCSIHQLNKSKVSPSISGSNHLVSAREDVLNKLSPILNTAIQNANKSPSLNQTVKTVLEY